jgi:hypothetical protein
MGAATGRVRSTSMQRHVFESEPNEAILALVALWARADGY